MARNSYPILSAIVILYSSVSCEYLRRLYRYCPGSYFSPKSQGRPSFLSGCFGAGTCRLKLLRPTAELGGLSGRWQKSGLFFAGRVPRKSFRMLNLGTFWGSFLRSAYLAAMLYPAIRIIEGLMIIALQVRRLGSLRVVSLHRQMSSAANVPDTEIEFFDFGRICWPSFSVDGLC